ncbi:Glutamate carboxypeptidase [Heracleum sosnowskyi]|uniref:glutamate carboxypeptidase II n=1 Tax=Heracleum sosnowskyi TaxID=360622 RepID=A0AAD8GT74_9APIA|nr:Glutamate carboxypeptidase [Heracleum sosnowskyi]
MYKLLIATLVAIASSFACFFSSLPQKSIYHSLYISSSFSDNASISQHLYSLTRRPHVAGTEANAEVARYVLSTLSSYNIRSHIKSYGVSLTYPVSRSLILTHPPSDTTYTFDLRQETYEGDPYIDMADEVLPTFYAYAKSGNVVGPVLYANYGRLEDFMSLKTRGVNVSGAVGAVLYTDRKDYGGGGDAKGFPNDKWMPPSGVQVGTLYKGCGDPTTPGWASTEECERISNEEVDKRGEIPLIPSLPVSAADGEAIIKSIGGEVADGVWQGCEDGPVYRIGPGPGILNLSYTGKQVINTIENVIGIIEGEEEPDRFVVLGNHRDAWTFGAVDPNSGTAALLEVAGRLRKLQKKGWKPRRTIIFCNWDAEEYGLTGSTEWVEENREMLASRVVAYLNVDIAVGGAGFYAASTPQLDQLLMQATQQVEDPDNSSQSIFDSWIGTSVDLKIGRLGGAGSDYAAFLQHVGIPAADMSFGKGYPVYHSMYDDFIWMRDFGDPMFRRHVAVASIWGLVALALADEEFLPFNYLSYAIELQKKADDIISEVLEKDINFTPLFKSIEDLKIAATKINSERKEIQGSKGWASMWKSKPWQVRQLNDRLMMAERAFIDRDGLLKRQWYKHLIYAPSEHNAYGSVSFPGISDAIERAKQVNTEESWSSVQHEVWRVSRAIIHVSLVLNGVLT